MPWGWGRGWRNWYHATGMPGWMRVSYGLPAFGRGWFRGNPHPFCRWFPWLPRWWWTGMYGPVQWTPQGPVLASQAPVQQQMTKEQEIRYLEQELKAIEEEKKMLEQASESIKKRIEELKKV